MFNEYEYEYHDLAEDADYIDQNDDTYYNSGNDEPWMVLDNSENETMDGTGWDNYYHNLANEIVDE